MATTGQRSASCIGHFLAVVSLLTLPGCAGKQQINDAVAAVNEEFRKSYEEALATSGTRTFRTTTQAGIAALRGCLTGMGMHVVDEDAEAGYLRTSGPAPSPLDTQDWQKAVRIDQPRFREILADHVGLLAYLVGLEPEGLDVIINGTAVQKPSDVEISLTMRTVETKPPPSGMPRRQYPPPSAVRIGLDKIWKCIDQHISSSSRSIP
ncbi:MAG: hypothetical protein R3F45_07270 [Gammaproteobacteria bacterium]